MTPLRALMIVTLLSLLGGCGALSPIRGPFGAAMDVVARPPSPPVSVPVSADNGCNGHPELCGRRYDQVTYATTHNAMSNADALWFQPNQQHGIRRQLDDGVRALMLDTHLSSGRVTLCHGLCVAGRTPLVDGLAEIRRFLRDNPREVLTLLVEAHVSAADTAADFARAGLLPLLYTHAAGEPWPTLGEMIAGGRRLVVFTEQGGGEPAWYHDLWQHSWETQYAVGGEGDFSCAQNRGTAGASLFLLNHFITRVFPSEAAARQVNMEDLLGARARQCMRQSGRLPNFVAVDFYATGDLLGVVDALNGVAGPGGSSQTRRAAP